MTIIEDVNYSLKHLKYLYALDEHKFVFIRKEDAEKEIYFIKEFYIYDYAHHCLIKFEFVLRSVSIKYFILNYLLYTFIIYEVTGGWVYLS